MNPELVLEILSAIVSVIQSQMSGKAQTDAELANTMLTIVQKAALAYQQQTGQPLDPALIAPEAGV